MEIRTSLIIQFMFFYIMKKQMEGVQSKGKKEKLLFSLFEILFLNKQIDGEKFSWNYKFN